MRILFGCFLAAAAFGQSDAQKRLNTAATVFGEVMGISDKAIPQKILDKSECAVIVPGLKKGAFIFGGKYGRGYVSCRVKGGTGCFF